jgi:hypothetical protein
MSVTRKTGLRDRKVTSLQGTTHLLPTDGWLGKLSIGQKSQLKMCGNVLLMVSDGITSLKATACRAAEPLRCRLRFP